MLRNIGLATAAAGALAFVAYSTPTVSTVLAAGVQLKPGLSSLVGVTDNPDLVLVKKGGGGKGSGKGGGKGKGKGAGHGDGGGKGKGKSAGHGDGGGKGHAKRGDEHRDGDKGHKRRKTVIVYRDGHRYWHDRRIWWWGPLVYSYDPCIRWVRFCPDCAPEPINICYYENY